MIATKDTQIEDLEASLENCKQQIAEVDAKLEQTQKRLANFQAELAGFALARERREQAEATLRPKVRETHEKLLQAQDYAKSAKGSIKNAAMDEVLAAETHHNEMDSQLQEMTKQHKAEQERDQPFVAEIESKIRSAKLSASQLEAQLVALHNTCHRLDDELGQAVLSYCSAVLRPAREECTRTEDANDKAVDIFARMKREFFPKLDRWPHLQRKLREENDVTDNREVQALLLFVALCEHMAEHPINNPEIARLLTFENYIWDEWEGQTSPRAFEEQARLVRLKLAELQAER